MHRDGVLAVLEIVAVRFAHELVPNAAIVDPSMGEQMGE
jgi:hypothetical protein